MDIGLIYSYESSVVGQFRYANQLINHLKETNNENIIEHPIERNEYQIFGKSVGGIISFQIKKLFRSFDEEIVHALDHHSASLKASLITIHDLLPYKYPNLYLNSFTERIYRKLNKIIEKKTPYFIVSTDHVKNDLIRMWNIKEDRIFKVALGINHNLFSPNNKMPECMEYKDNVILFVGNNDPRRGLPLLLKAMKYLENVKLVWVGNGGWRERTEQCYQIIKNNKLDVEKVGRIPDEILKNYYSNADLLVYPSLDEGFGFTPLEAMACGTTSVVSDIPVFREVLQDSVYYTELDGKKIAETIKRGFEKPFEPKRLIDYSKNFNWEDTAKNTIGIYKKISENMSYSSQK